jgi:two-component system chemotaxis response regulator CheY
MVSFTLRDAGYDVIEASDGQDALQKLSGKAVHLIVTDLNMPNMDGITLIKNVRNSASNKFTPIIMLTTESQDEKKAEGRQAGATGWIIKPFKQDQLLAVIKKVIG